MKTSWSIGYAAENPTGEPQYSDSWARGDLVDSGLGQTDVLVVRIME